MLELAEPIVLSHNSPYVALAQRAAPDPATALQALAGLSDDLCMAVMRQAALPLHRLLTLLPAGTHPLALQAYCPSIFAQHSLTLTHATVPLLLLSAPLLAVHFPKLTSISLRGQPLPNLDAATLFRGLGALPRLSNLDMSNTVWSPAAAAAAATHLPASPTLRSMSLTRVRIAGAALALLIASLRALRTLRKLAVSSTERGSDFSAAVGCLHAISGLQFLTLDVPNGTRGLLAVPPSYAGLLPSMHDPEAAACGGLQWLRRLHISSGRPLSTRQLLRVSSLQRLEDLKVATWDCSRHGDVTAPRSDAVMHVLAQLSGLSCLDLSMHVATDTAENAFLGSAGVSRLRALRTLRISAPCAVLGDEFLAGLAHVAAGGMREISLRNADVSPLGARLLAQDVRCAAARLEVLQLDTWPVGEAAQLASALNGLSALTRLDLCRCTLADDEIDAIASCMGSMRALQVLALGCARMTRTGCTALADALAATPAPIRSLEVVGNGIGPGREDLAMLSRCFPRLGMLQELSVGLLGVKDPTAARHFAEDLAAATTLTMLRLEQVGASPHACESISGGLSQLVNLQRLELQSHMFGMADSTATADYAPFTRSLAALTALTALCCVHCTGMSRDLGTAVAIVRAAATAAPRVLRELRLSCCAITMTVAAVPACAHLVPQHAQHSAGRRAVTALCDALAGMHALEVLDLSGNTVLGDEFALQFADTAQLMPTLRRVSLVRCGVHAHGLRRLLQWLPGAECAQQLQLNEFVVGAAEVEDAVRGAVACCHVG